MVGNHIMECGGKFESQMQNRIVIANDFVEHFANKSKGGFNPILVGGGGGKKSPPSPNLEKNRTPIGPKARRGSEFIFILVLHVLAKKTRFKGLSKETFLDFVE